MKLFLTSLLLLITCSAPAQIIHRVAGTVGVGGYSGNGGPATAAVLQNPNSVALDTLGNLYIADGDNDVIQKVDTAGIITTIAGNGGRGYSGDGGPATDATLNSPGGLSLDIAGNIYFADLGNNLVRVIDGAGIIKTVAGTFTLFGSYSGDGGPATIAKFNEPFATAVDNLGNLYVCDFINSVIRKITVSGNINTIAGNHIYGYSGDGGPATNAELFGPTGIAVDDTGSLYIADSRNNVIRKVDTFGIITTLAGNGMGGYSGDGGPATAAQLITPEAISINNFGIYIDDYDVIRKISKTGIITTVAGNNIPGYSGDGAQAIYASIMYPLGLAIDRNGNLYFGDVYNFVVRKVDTSMALAGLSTIIRNNGNSIYPNPANNIIKISSDERIAKVVILNAIGKMVFNESLSNHIQQLVINIDGFLPGTYFVKLNDTIITKFVKQ